MTREQKLQQQREIMAHFRALIRRHLGINSTAYERMSAQARRAVRDYVYEREAELFYGPCPTMYDLIRHYHGFTWRTKEYQ